MSKIFRYSKADLLKHFKVFEEPPKFFHDHESVTVSKTSQERVLELRKQLQLLESNGKKLSILDWDTHDEIFDSKDSVHSREETSLSNSDQSSRQNFEVGPSLPENKLHPVTDDYKFGNHIRINPHFVGKHSSKGFVRNFQNHDDSNEDGQDDQEPEWLQNSISDFKESSHRISMNDSYIYVDKNGKIEGPVALSQLSEWLDLMILDGNINIQRVGEFEFNTLSYVLNSYKSQGEDSKEEDPNKQALEKSDEKSFDFNFNLSLSKQDNTPQTPFNISTVQSTNLPLASQSNTSTVPSSLPSTLPTSIQSSMNIPINPVMNPSADQAQQLAGVPGPGAPLIQGVPFEIPKPGMDQQIPQFRPPFQQMYPPTFNPSMQSMSPPFGYTQYIHPHMFPPQYFPMPGPQNMYQMQPQHLSHHFQHPQHLHPQQPQPSQNDVVSSQQSSLNRATDVNQDNSRSQKEFLTSDNTVNPFNVSPFSIDEQFSAEDLESQFLKSAKSTKVQETTQIISSSAKITTTQKVKSDAEEFTTITKPKRQKHTPSKTEASVPKPRNVPSATGPLIAKPPKPIPIVQHVKDIEKKGSSVPASAPAPVKVIAQPIDEYSQLIVSDDKPRQSSIVAWGGTSISETTGTGLDMKKIQSEQIHESKKQKKLDKLKKEEDQLQKVAWSNVSSAPKPVSLLEITKEEERLARKKQKEEQKKALSSGGSAADLIRGNNVPVWGSVQSAPQPTSLLQILKEEKKSKKKAQVEPAQQTGWNVVQPVWGSSSSEIKVVTAPSVKSAKSETKSQSSSDLWNFDEPSKVKTETQPSSKSKKKSKKSKSQKSSTVQGSSQNDDFNIPDNPFGKNVSKTFRSWYRDECKRMGKAELANESLLTFLWSVPEKELPHYVESYFGRSNRAFAAEFISQRSFDKGNVDVIQSKKKK